MALLDKDFLSYADIAELLGVDYATIHRWVTKGKYEGIPQPYKFTPKKVLFKTSEIVEWIETKRIS